MPARNALQSACASRGCAESTPAQGMFTLLHSAPAAVAVQHAVQQRHGAGRSGVPRRPCKEDRLLRHTPPVLALADGHRGGAARGGAGAEVREQEAEGSACRQAKNPPMRPHPNQAAHQKGNRPESRLKSRMPALQTSLSWPPWPCTHSGALQAGGGQDVGLGG